MSYNALPKTTFANLPSASAAGANAIYFVTDVGPAGTFFVSDGTLWRPQNGICLLAQNNAGLANTGNTTENVLATVNLPANLMGVNSALEIVTAWSFPANANAKNIKARLGGISGAGYLAFNQNNGSNVSCQVYTLIRARAAGSQFGFSNTQSGFSGGQASSNATSSLDMTAAQTLVFTAQCGVGTDTITLESYTVKLLAG
jgi:hypothetical protein